MLTFCVGVIACLMFPPMIFGVIGFSIGGIWVGVVGLIIGIAFIYD